MSGEETNRIKKIKVNNNNVDRGEASDDKLIGRGPVWEKSVGEGEIGKKIKKLKKFENFKKNV